MDVMNVRLEDERCCDADEGWLVVACCCCRQAATVTASGDRTPKR